MANVAVTNTTGLYGTSSKTPVLNSAQQLLSLLDNNGNVNFALDPATGNTTVYSYFTGNATGGNGGGTLSLYGSVNASGPLGAPILTVLTPTGVTSGTYGNATSIPVINVGSDGRVDSITTITTAASTYSNANVASYLPVYNGNITAAYVNIAQLLTSQRANITGNVNAGNVNTTGYFVGDGSKLTNLPIGPSSYGNANVAAYMPSYLPTYHGTLAPTIISTDNYLFANGQPFVTPTSYGNANVAAYLPTDSTITTLQSEITGANAAIVTANTAMKSYVDAQDTSITNAWTANAATQAGQIASVSAELHSFETYANATYATSSSSYGNSNVAAYLPTDSTIIGIQTNVSNLQSNAASQEGEISGLRANIIAANAAIAATTAELHSFETYANATFGTSNYGNANVAVYLPTYTGTMQVGNITTTAGTHNIGSPSAPFDTINVGNIAGASGSVVRVDSSGSQPGLYVEPTGITSFQRDFTVETAGLVNAVTLTQAGTVTAIGTISGANLLSGAQIIAQGNITANATAGAYFIGDGSKLTNLPVQPGSYGNSNVAAYLPTYNGSLNNSSSIISLQGNITAANAAIASTNANLASFQTYANANFITSATSYSNANVAAYLVTNTGNIQTGNITPYATGVTNLGASNKIFGTAYIANLYNVTSLTGTAGDVLKFDTNPTPGNDGLYIQGTQIETYNKQFRISTDTSGPFAYVITLDTDGSVTAQGNITANAAAGAYFIGDGSKLTNIPVQPGTYGNANVAAYLPTYTGNIGGNITTAAQTKITSLGTLTGLTVNGQLTVNGSGPLEASSVAGNFGSLTTGTGVYVNNSVGYGGSFTDGVVLDYVTGNARVSTGTSDGINFYNGGVGTTLLANIGTTGDITATGKLITTSGVFWSNGTAYSTGGGSSFTGNLAGSTLTDSVNQRILANASPASSLPTTGTSSQVAAVYTLPIYTTGVLGAPSSSQSVIVAQSANIALQSSYTTSGARNTIGNETYLSVYPTTANTMTNSDRVRSVQAHLDIIPGGKSWGNLTTNSSSQAPVLSAMGAQTSFIGTGNVSHMVGHTTSAFVYPNGGSANVAYQTGVFSSLGWNTASSATASNIANVRIISGNIAVGSQANLTITNAIGLHTPVGWAGAGALVTNRYSVLNEDTATVIQTAGNISVTGNLNMAAFKETITSLGSTSGTIAPVSTAASVFTLTLTGNMTLNAANLSTMYIGQSITLVITQGGTGSYTLTSDLKFAGGSKTLSTAVGAIDILNIFYDGTNYLASLVKGYA